MANKTFPQLTETLTILDNGVIPYDSGTQTFKSKLSTLRSYFLTGIQTILNTNATKINFIVNNFFRPQWNAELPLDYNSLCVADNITEVGRVVCVGQVSGSGAYANMRIIQSSSLNSWLPGTYTAVIRNWMDVCYSSSLDLFVAVSNTTTNTQQILTSPDGSTWTMRTSPNALQWVAVCWSPELNLFVAVAQSGTGNRVMTSPDGVTWTARTSAANVSWNDVCWSPSLGLFVAVAGSDATSSNNIMTSPDGVTWTSRSGASGSGGREWAKVVWSPQLNLFVTVAAAAVNDNIMTSPDGVTWTARTKGNTESLVAIAWSPELKIFLSLEFGTVNRQAWISSDGITWSEKFISGIQGLGVKDLVWSSIHGKFIVCGAGNASALYFGVGYSLGLKETL